MDVIRPFSCTLLHVSLRRRLSYIAASVIAAEARRQPIAETLALVGTLAANEFIEVKSEIDGTIAEILFEEGQPVKKGDLFQQVAT